MAMTQIVFLVMLSGPAFAFSVLFPQDESFVTTSSVYLVFNKDGNDIDAYQVNVNKFGYPKIAVAKDRKYFYFKIFLASGMNKITVKAYRGRKKVAIDELDVFFRDQLGKNFNHEPLGFTRYLFHMPENEKLCADCHRMDVIPDDINPDSPKDSPKDSPCYICHKEKLDSKYVHKPASKWKCLTCHLTKEDSRKFSVVKPTIDVCSTCHDKIVKDWSERKFIHGPTAVGQCELCHDPHGAVWPSLLRMHGTDLCLRCHVDKKNGKHVLAGFYGKGHPTRGVPDPKDPSKEFTCAGCHNPHGAETEDLLNHPRIRGGMGYCRNCHQK